MIQIKFFNDVLNKNLTFYAGSFLQLHERLNKYNYYTVNLMEEAQELPSCLNIPIKDYSVPKNLKDFNDNVFEIIKQSYFDNDVFFGCFGGVGRTGIVLATLIKTFDPSITPDELIKQTRNFIPHALETEDQINFVKNFNTSYLINKINTFSNQLHTTKKINFSSF